MYKPSLFMIVLVFLGPVLAEKSVATSECPLENYFNGTSCTPCKKCGPGYGVKTHCTEKEDTECQQCWPRYDYSNTTSMEECLPCVNKESKCLPGNPKVIANCTIFSPTVCSGCADGNHFDSSMGPKGGCVACSPPCKAFEVEVMDCSTEHDRSCIKQSTTQEPDASTNATDSVSKKLQTSTIPSTAPDRTEPPSVAESSNNYPTADTQGENRLWFLFFILLAIPPVIIVVAFKKKSGRLKKPEGGHSSDLEQAHPLMPRGLDTLIRDLDIHDRKFISKHLNGKDTDGYYYWQLTAEKLGLRDEIRNWERADNPSEKLLTVFAEKEGSTIRKIIEACKKVGLTLFASELEKKFSPANQRGSDEYTADGHATYTWV